MRVYLKRAINFAKLFLDGTGRHLVVDWRSSQLDGMYICGNGRRWWFPPKITGFAYPFSTVRTSDQSLRGWFAGKYYKKARNAQTVCSLLVWGGQKSSLDLITWLAKECDIYDQRMQMIIFLVPIKKKQCKCNGYSCETCCAVVVVWWTEVWRRTHKYQHN